MMYTYQLPGAIWFRLQTAIEALCQIDKGIKNRQKTRLFAAIDLVEKELEGLELYVEDLRKRVDSLERLQYEMENLISYEYEDGIRAFFPHIEFGIISKETKHV